MQIDEYKKMEEAISNYLICKLKINKFVLLWNFITEYNFIKFLIKSLC